MRTGRKSFRLSSGGSSVGSPRFSGDMMRLGVGPMFSGFGVVPASLSRNMGGIVMRYKWEYGNGTCDICNGTGVTPEDVSCKCEYGRLREWVIKYLTPRYRVPSDNSFDKFPVETFLKNYFIEGANKQRFKALVRNVLFRSECKYSHMTLSGYEFLQDYYLNKDEDSPKNIGDLWDKPDLLILILGYDPPNAHFSAALEALIYERVERGKWTWVNSRHPLDSEHFTKVYDIDLWNSFKERQYKEGEIKSFLKQHSFKTFLLEQEFNKLNIQ
jgi:hypothetical protein